MWKNAGNTNFKATCKKKASLHFFNFTLSDSHATVTWLQEQLVAAKGPEEDTALHLAARRGDNDLIKFFIEAGAKVDAQNVSHRHCPGKYRGLE